MLIDIIVGIIIKLLQAFFESLFKKDKEPTVDQKRVYMTKVKRLFFLGPRRIDIANRAWDIAATKYYTVTVQTALNEKDPDKANSVIFLGLKDRILSEIA